jgi:hypothetical protein
MMFIPLLISSLQELSIALKNSHALEKLFPTLTYFSKLDKSISIRSQDRKMEISITLLL